MANECDLGSVRVAARSDSGAVIRDAALRGFAAHGVAATSLRLIASDAGVSLGLVQHRFGTKERLVEAVDQYVLDVVQSQLALDDSHGRQGAAEESVEDTGRRVRSLITDYPEVVDYMARAMVDETPIGTRTFDALFAMGRQRWGRRAEHDQLHPDVVDVTWAALNPLLLALGTIILRRHVERQLSEPFTEPTQLQRWESSVNSLLRHGQMR
jgi:AcrR family transcriptional regulator